MFQSKRFTALCLLLIFSVSSCKTREFNNSPQNDSSTEAAKAVKAFGGPFNFGINYAPVDEKIATDFWASHKNGNSFTAQTLKASKITFWEGEPEEDIFREAVSHPTAAKEIDKIVRLYMQSIQQWLKLTCQEVDMNAAAQGQYKFSAARQKTASNDIATCDFTPRNSSEKSFDGNVEELLAKSSVWKPREGLPKNAPDFTIDSSTYMFSAVRHDEKSHVINVTVEPELIVGAQKISIRNGKFEFIIAGDYIYPWHSWRVSKSFATPVMKFDGNPKSSRFLQSVAFYDFGLLTLNSLPKEGNILASRMGDTLAEFWKDPAQRHKVGNLMHKLPERVNKFLQPFEHLDKKIEFDPMMQRVIVGSTHFVINSFWTQRRGGLDNLIAVMDVKRDELIQLYLGNSIDGQAWINTLDRLRTAPSDQLAKFRAFLETKDCKKTAPIIGQIPGTHIETEIVIGGQAGRNLLLNKKVLALRCDFSL